MIALRRFFVVSRGAHLRYCSTSVAEALRCGDAPSTSRGEEVLVEVHSFSFFVEFLAIERAGLSATASSHRNCTLYTCAMDTVTIYCK